MCMYCVCVWVCMSVCLVYLSVCLSVWNNLDYGGCLSALHSLKFSVPQWSMEFILHMLQRQALRTNSVDIGEEHNFLLISLTLKIACLYIIVLITPPILLSPFHPCLPSFSTNHFLRFVTFMFCLVAHLGCEHACIEIHFTFLCNTYIKLSLACPTKEMKNYC